MGQGAERAQAGRRATATGTVGNNSSSLVVLQNSEEVLQSVASALPVTKRGSCVASCEERKGSENESAVFEAQSKG